jgi:hypothetical protein
VGENQDGRNGAPPGDTQEGSQEGSQEGAQANGAITPPTGMEPPRADASETYGETYGDISAELERQAREMLDAIRESAGDLGERVRQALDRASSLWDEAHPGIPVAGAVSPQDEQAARSLARRWVERDFLVDPELPGAITVTGVARSPVWRVELRERGETRSLGEGREPYDGQRFPAPGPVLPVWDYAFPAIPDIEAGERRERIAGTEMVAACATCNGTGHRPCRACDGKGFVQCPTCHGRARVMCRRCRGRGRIADARAERRARASKSYLQVQAERLATGAGERIADFAERLRQDYGVPLPPSGDWMPTAPASGETIPCPDCVNGTVPCTCGNGKLICEQCHGSGAAPCPACGATGRVVRYRQLVRRFDTEISERRLPFGEGGQVGWLQPHMLRGRVGEVVWEGERDEIYGVAPETIPPEVWAAAQAFVRDPLAGSPDEGSAERPSKEGERRIISRRVRVSRVPVARVEYAFAGRPFSFVAVGRSGETRFWAQDFPPRWSRVGRFLKALTRDLQNEGAGLPQKPLVPGNGELTSLEDFRARRLRIRGDESAETSPETDATPTCNGQDE